ncbi:AMP-binding protein [Actinomadura sp. HBU206391]|uniref:AMP-binding protein n=1 Tax=Actinomadura sp. HBU206391 TaxID=2731692 RepID=UPI00164F1952|nr:AMP-binding protein [Actinomadura sp. HBU206391]MBC6462973.1 AMP-binding protein [Actinomadura sp. HBU206391]
MTNPRHPQDEYRRHGWWRDETFLDDLRKAVRAQPGKRAVVARNVGRDTTRVLDYAELSLLTERCAGALIDLGVAPGDVVAVQLRNRWELAPLVLGCMRAGARLCPLVPEYRRRELEHMLRLTEARVFITMREWDSVPLGEIGVSLTESLPALEHVLVADVAPGDEPPTGSLEFEPHIFATPWEERHRPDGRGLGPDDPCLVLFTSGTTGEPKGAVHSQNTLYAAIRGEAEVFGLGADLVMSVASIYTHYSGLVQGMLMPLMLGGTMAFLDDLTGPDYLDLIERHGVTFLYSTPTYLLDLLDAQRTRARAAGGLRHVVTGSAPVAPHLVAEIKKAFGVRVFALWGMTENGPVTMTRPDEPEDWAASSDGRPIDGMEVRIDPLPGRSDGAGRLWVRGATQCLGYYQRDELYAAVLDEDGWFDTGDLARPDGRGGIRLVGRAKDLVMRHGFPVPVTEVEAVLARHPKVREVAVIGIPDVNADEMVCAVVTPATEPPTLSELRGYLNEAEMMEWFWPERLEMVDAMPKTITGKIRKVELQQRYAGT